MKRYFYIDSSGKQKGSYSPEALRNEDIKRDTFVWTNGMTDWLPADQVEELSFLFEGTSGYYPPQMPPQYTQSSVKDEEKDTPPMPKNWLMESILVTIIPLITCGSFLSLLGIVGIVSASRVEGQYNSGEYTQAADSAKQAKRWTLITFWITIGWVLILVLSIIALVVFGVSLGSFSEWIDSSVYSI